MSINLDDLFQTRIKYLRMIFDCLLVGPNVPTPRVQSYFNKTFTRICADHIRCLIHKKIQPSRRKKLIKNKTCPY